MCEPFLSLPAKPVLQLNPDCKILIIGHAPGLKAHHSGIPFTDQSGERLVDWLGISQQQLYSETFSIIPMSFCYPGKGKSGDNPPIPTCYNQWHKSVVTQLSKVETTILLGRYAQDAYLSSKNSLTENCKMWQQFSPEFWPLPHPSPRNNIWLKKNAWFTQELLPELKQAITQILSSNP